MQKGDAGINIKKTDIDISRLNNLVIEDNAHIFDIDISGNSETVTNGFYNTYNLNRFNNVLFNESDLSNEDTLIFQNNQWKLTNISNVSISKGDIGPTGDIGLTGTIGDQGAIGVQGAIGEQGSIGDQGPDGDTGVQGFKGEIGENLKGDTGPTGPQGDMGPTGSQGDTGATGSQGDTGPVGDIGQKGNQGPQGNTGVFSSLTFNENEFYIDNRVINIDHISYLRYFTILGYDYNQSISSKYTSFSDLVRIKTLVDNNNTGDYFRVLPVNENFYKYKTPSGVWVHDDTNGNTSSVNYSNAVEVFSYRVNDIGAYVSRNGSSYQIRIGFEVSQSGVISGHKVRVDRLRIHAPTTDYTNYTNSDSSIKLYRNRNFVRSFDVYFSTNPLVDTDAGTSVDYIRTDPNWKFLQSVTLDLRGNRSRYTAYDFDVGNYDYIDVDLDYLLRGDYPNEGISGLLFTGVTNFDNFNGTVGDNIIRMGRISLLQRGLHDHTDISVTNFKIYKQTNYFIDFFTIEFNINFNNTDSDGNDVSGRSLIESGDMVSIYLNDFSSLPKNLEGYVYIESYDTNNYTNFNKNLIVGKCIINEQDPGPGSVINIVFNDNIKFTNSKTFIVKIDSFNTESDITQLTKYKLVEN